MEIDQVVVDKKDWGLAMAGDEDAKARISGAIDGLQLYVHILSYDPEKQMVVTLRDLEGLNILEYVYLETRK